MDFDLPDAFMPEFPPAIFLQNRPELGDVSRGEVVSINNFYALFKDLLTPVQLMACAYSSPRCRRKSLMRPMTARVLPPAWGLPAWTAMSTAIRRLSSISIRMTARRSGGCGSIPPACGGVQQIHGSKRSLRSVEDFTEFEQRTAYFNGDPIHAMKKA